MKGKKGLPKIIAFYLPQYHTIPENDNWWGEGFTDWVNVKKAKRLFFGHYQPRIPYGGRYYDLSDIRSLSYQAWLAKQYGIDGFCIYHYWFNGKKLLEKPLELLLNNKQVSLPYCICWANEPWIRTWDGNEDAPSKEVLIQQVYGKKEDWKKHFDYLLSFFQDERYIKLEQKPVLLIYRAEQIPHFNDMIVYWESLAREKGLEGLYILQMNTSFGYKKYDSQTSGIVDFEPMRTLRDRDEQNLLKIKRKEFLMNTIKDSWLKNILSIRLFSYSKFVKIITRRKDEFTQKQYYCVYPGWDNSPRKKAACIWYGASPEKFYYFLRKMLKKSTKAGNEFLFVNAWNEWAEGAYLEPDKKYGYQYLQAVCKAKLHS